MAVEGIETFCAVAGRAEIVNAAAESPVAPSHPPKVATARSMTAGTNTAEIRSAPGEGTEVELVLPREVPV